MQRDNINHYVAMSEIIVRKVMRFYTRETNRAAFCAKQRILSNPHFFLIIKPTLNSLYLNQSC